MDLAHYFENAGGLGVLATADAAGVVDAACYARPHVMESDTVAFIMKDRRSHANVRENPNAAYLFIENRREGEPLRGVRLYLSMIEEERDTERLYRLRRRTVGDPAETRFLVFFHVDEIRPLVGDDDSPPDDGPS